MQLPLGIKLPDSSSFDNYFPAENLATVEALQHSVLDNGEQFIFLWGAAGSGKTHLLQAACRTASEQGAVSYLPLAHAHELEPMVLEGLEAMSLVCIDDLHTIAGNAKWEQALFHLYNRLRDSHTRLVISANANPNTLDIQLPDLQSRLNWGLTMQLHGLDDDNKLGALQLRASHRGFELPQAVGRYLLKHIPRDMPSLFDLLDQLDEASLAEQRKLTIPFVKKVAGLE